MKYLLINILTSVTIIGSMLSGTAAAAGTASFSLSPSGGSYVQNNSFTIQVSENGTDVNVVTAKLSYDAAKLRCDGVGGNSAFPNTVVATCGSGNITISRYSTTNVTGNVSVGSITFTALTGSGNTAVSFASGSQIASNGANIWNGSTTGATYAFSAPVIAQPTPTPQVVQPIQSVSPTTTSNSTSTSTATKKLVSTTGTALVAASSESTSETTAPIASVDNNATKILAVTTNNTNASTSNNKLRNTSAIISIIVLIIAIIALVYILRSRRAVATVVPSTTATVTKATASAKSPSISKKVTP